MLTVSIQTSEETSLARTMILHFLLLIISLSRGSLLNSEFYMNVTWLFKSLVLINEKIIHFFYYLCLLKRHWPCVSVLLAKRRRKL